MTKTDKEIVEKLNSKFNESFNDATSQKDEWELFVEMAKDASNYVRDDNPHEAAVSIFLNSERGGIVEDVVADKSIFALVMDVDQKSKEPLVVTTFGNDNMPGINPLSINDRNEIKEELEKNFLARLDKGENEFDIFKSLSNDIFARTVKKVETVVSIYLEDGIIDSVLSDKPMRAFQFDFDMENDEDPLQIQTYSSPGKETDESSVTYYDQSPEEDEEDTPRM